jgi:ribosomal protein S18 acetylase RimI-like enzyme
VDIAYNETQKDLPPEQLRDLFVSVGWSDGSETQDMVQKGYCIPWVNSTLVVSAWANERLIGAVRVLSDTMFRSIIYDLLVLPEYQNKGIGSELLRRCIERFPDSEWLVQTTEEISGYYEKHGFKINNDAFLTIPSKLFTINS